MISQEPAGQSSRRTFLTIAQLVVSLGGLFVSLLALAVLGISDRYLQAQTGVTQTGAGQLNLLIGLLLLLALSCIPSIVLSIRWLKRIEPREVNSDLWMTVSSILLIVWVGALFAGAFLLKVGQTGPLLLIANLLVIVLPLAWLIGFSLRKIKIGSWKRFWGVITGTFYITLPLIILVEGMILVGIILVFSAFLANQSGFQDILNQLSQLSPSTLDQMDQLLNQLSPVLTSSQAIYALFFAFGLLIPLVEEFLKPLMVWVFVRRNLKPSEGFALGLISGAAFALIESLFALNATGGSDYYAIALGRTGTGLLHTFTTGMMGWALAATWRDGKGWRLGLAYGGAALLHGAWNSFALVMGFGSLPLRLPGLFSSMAPAIPWILAMLAVWMLTLLYVMNGKLANEGIEDQPSAPKYIE